jgi:serine/threonine protein kinase
MEDLYSSIPDNAELKSFHFYSNVGFDVRGDAKLFDFGLATEFDADKEKDQPFKLTGDTGTLRYMAPEGKRCCSSLGVAVV